MRRRQIGEGPVRRIVVGIVEQAAVVRARSAVETAITQREAVNQLAGALRQITNPAHRLDFDAVTFYNETTILGDVLSVDVGETEHLGRPGKHVSVEIANLIARKQTVGVVLFTAFAADDFP